MKVVVNNDREYKEIETKVMQLNKKDGYITLEEGLSCFFAFNYDSVTVDGREIKMLSDGTYGILPKKTRKKKED